MKPGDKVFHFNGKEIIEGVCTSTYQFAHGHTYVNCRFPGASYVNDPHHLRHGEWFADAILWEEVFPTREALCEYYRKILSNMKLIWHHNTWPWGKTVEVIKSDGSAFVEMSFEDTQPGVCYLSGLSVIESQRRKGIAKHLMLTCESYCRGRGIFRIDLNSVLTDWVQDFYKKCGYTPIKEENGFMQMYKLM